MKVVGGAYRETCAVPAHDEIVGSGLRAAAVLRAVSPGISLITAVEDPPHAVDAVIAGLSLQAPLLVESVARNEAVGFSYFTPLSTPAINGGRSQMEPIEAEDDVVLVFRMVEAGVIRVRAGAVVLDPQQPRDLAELKLEWIESDRLAIVANRAETLALAGFAVRDSQGPELIAAARLLLDRYGAEAVVVKRGAQGSLVVTESGADTVGVFPTERVYPIGSGDVFAAGFAWAWGENGADPVAAARVGSRAASEWCRTRSLWMSGEAFSAVPVQEELGPRNVTVYLAAPFFTLGELWLVELVRDALFGLGASVFSPCHDVGEGGDEVALADLEGLARSHSILALLDGDDAGTLFETGWASSSQRPVVGYAHRPSVEGGKMLRGSGSELHTDLSTAVYRAIWAGMN